MKMTILIFMVMTFNVFGALANFEGPNISDDLQQTRVTGTVSDENGNPLPGVNIQVEGTTIGAISDISGKYTIILPNDNVVLIFSFIGYINQKVSPAGKTTINISLVPSIASLEEVVVVGYGTQKRTTMTGSVSVVKGESIANVPVANISNSIAGRMAGVSMRPRSGQPGKDSPDIYIRGLATTGSTAPLIVIDGIIRDNINQVDPTVVESVSVLKDAAAVAPYGLAGANGVILITTKKGQEGAPTMSVGSYYGWQAPTYLPNPLNAKDYMRLRNEAYLNENPGGTNLPYALDLINTYDALNAKDPDVYGNSNVTDLLNLRAPIRKHNMQISGGSAKAKYFGGFGYYKQDGLVDRCDYSRYNYNMNLDLNVTNSTTVSLSLVGSQEQTDDLDPEYSSYQLFRTVYKYFPTSPLYYTNGLWGLSAGNAPIAEINAGGYLKDKGNTLLSRITVEQKLPFIEGLSVKGVFSYDTRNNFIKGYHTPFYYYIQNTSTTPYTYTKTSAGVEGATSYTYLRETLTMRKYLTYQGIINYQRSFGVHELSGLIVAEARNNQYDILFARRNNFAVNIDELDMGSSVKSDFDNSGSSAVGAQIGYVYRLGYVYNNKYMLEATGRYDGHYYFAPGKRWGYFPAFSMGWRLSEESFMKSLTYINNLKIRGSWGKSGNLAGSAYQYLSGYTLVGGGYAFGPGTMVQSAYNAQESNPNITWEISTKSNLGFEATLWNSLLMIEADYFFENRTGMLLSPAITVPSEYGLSLAQENAGEMKNQGFELRVGSKYKLQNGLSLGFDGNISVAKNKMVQVFETSATYDNLNRRRTGRAFGTPFGYHSLGLFTTKDDVNQDGKINSADGYNITQFGALSPGDIKYEDISGPAGVPDGKIDGNDEISIGYPGIPSMVFGFTTTAEWKGFDLNLFFQGSAMVSLDIGTFETVAFQNNKSNCDYEYFNNHWTPANENAAYPRANTSPSANNTQYSDFWVLNTSHLRLKTSVLGYTLPTSVTQFLKIKNLRVYLSGQNLVTLSKLKFKDPETAAYGSREAVAYPNMKSFSFGADVTF